MHDIAAFHFYIGLHQPSDAQHFERVCIHVDRLRTRKKPLGCKELLLDSRAFMTLKIHKQFTRTPEQYALSATRIAQLVDTLIVVTQDYMCEPFMLAQTGLTIPEHQRLTIERYDAIRVALPAHIPMMPVLQGYLPEQYARHIADYGARLARDMHVGVGSVCKRNASPREIGAVLRARPFDALWS
jgi:hypothetical protein